MRIVKFLAALVLLAAVGLVGFAYLGDLSPRQSEIRVPVTLDETPARGADAGADGS